MFKAALWPTQSPIQWVLWLLPWGKSSWAMRLTTQLHLVLRLRSGIIPPLPLYALKAHRVTT